MPHLLSLPRASLETHPHLKRHRAVFQGGQEKDQGSRSLPERDIGAGDGFQSSGGREDEVAEGRDESRGYRLDRGGIKSIGTRTNQTGIPGRNAGCLKGLTEMAEGNRIWLDQISTSYGTQPPQRKG